MAFDLKVFSCFSALRLKISIRICMAIFKAVASKKYMSQISMALKYEVLGKEAVMPAINEAKTSRQVKEPMNRSLKLSTSIQKVK